MTSFVVYSNSWPFSTVRLIRFAHMISRQHCWAIKSTENRIDVIEGEQNMKCFLFSYTHM